MHMFAQMFADFFAKVCAFLAFFWCLFAPSCHSPVRRLERGGGRACALCPPPKNQTRIILQTCHVQTKNIITEHSFLIFPQTFPRCQTKTETLRNYPSVTLTRKRFSICFEKLFCFFERLFSKFVVVNSF